MSVINIRKAKRAGARLVIALAGTSGSGKTRTALELAFGMVNGDASKIGCLDTENKRGSLYADVLKNEAGEVQQFFIGDLEPPFTPQRYSDAIKAFQDHGVEVLVIDSVTHEYEGTGGILEMREPLPGQQGKRDNIAKAEHKKFMNTLLQSNMHIIACVRAREKVVIEKQAGKTVYIPQGVQPIQEKNFMFESTVSLMMWDSGKSQQILKCPEELMSILGREKGYLTPEDGLALRNWVNGAEPIDPAVEAAKSALKMVCEQGMDALVANWKKLPAPIRKAISADGKCPEEYKLSAQAYDDARKPQNDPGLDDLNDSVLGGQAA